MVLTVLIGAGMRLRLVVHHSGSVCDSGGRGIGTGSGNTTIIAGEYQQYDCSRSTWGEILRR